MDRERLDEDEPSLVESTGERSNEHDREILFCWLANNRSVGRLVGRSIGRSIKSAARSDRADLGCTSRNDVRGTFPGEKSTGCSGGKVRRATRNDARRGGLT